MGDKELTASKESDIPSQQPSQTDAMLAVIERLATNPDADVTKLEKMLDMQERVMNRNAEMEFNAAMTKAQSEMGRIQADMQNNQTRSMYASYAQLDRKLRPIYTRHGFSLSFDTGELREAVLPVICYVSHVSGHSRTYNVQMPADGLGAKGNAVMSKTHAVGSASSYGMRYLLKMIFNIAIGEDDDDGNGAEGIELITEEQLANIDALIDEIGAGRQEFSNYMNVDNLADIPAKEYKKAVSALENYRKRNEAE